MADADTSRLCVQIVRSQFGPLAAVSFHGLSTRSMPLIYDFPECRMCIINARKTFTCSAHSLHDDETALSTRCHLGSCAAQYLMAFQHRGGGRNAGV